MTRYHVNPDTGRPNICNAKVRCDFAVNGVEPPHYADKNEARLAAEDISKVLSGKTEVYLSGVKKTLTNDTKVFVEDDNGNLVPTTVGAMQSSFQPNEFGYTPIKVGTKSFRIIEVNGFVHTYDDSGVLVFSFLPKAGESNEKGFYEAYQNPSKRVSREEVAKQERAPRGSNVDANGNTIYRDKDTVEDTVFARGSSDYESTEFRRLTNNVYSDAPYAYRFQVGKELTKEEAAKIAQLVGYAYSKTGGERFTTHDVTQDSPNSIVISMDTTKGRAYRNLEAFEKELPQILAEGTPTRKTDKAGPGTAGTRLVEGFGEDNLKYLEIYSDSWGEDN